MEEAKDNKADKPSDHPEKNPAAAADTASKGKEPYNPEKRPAVEDPAPGGKEDKPRLKKSKPDKPNSGGSDSPLPKEPLKIPKQEFRDPSFFKICLLCARQKPNYRIFRVRKCWHEFCHDCFGKSVDETLNKDTHIFVCPAENCKEVIGYQSCCNVLPDDVSEKWDKMLCEALLEGYEKFYCPFEGCKEMMVKETNEAIKEAECPSCYRLFCAKCAVPWHASISCEDFQKQKVNQ
ncbi:OLC1v1014481C1 [Oldenlandia corymbosa var. corymbosa]|uniref:RBR-type E3 ubiquitin transferase n=1 Tax=Oldenlandia corymbosa var. corymbosa TaxID=529605 RepID=A0AAV1E145_OLDCO|nr:OLC1v1014481C1 [Oldenlandia corymbosa var. corymbosa]